MVPGKGGFFARERARATISVDGRLSQESGSLDRMILWASHLWPRLAQPPKYPLREVTVNLGCAGSVTLSV